MEGSGSLFEQKPHDPIVFRGPSAPSNDGRLAVRPAAKLGVRRTSRTRRTQPRLTARRGNGTRHNRMIRHASTGSYEPKVSILGELPVETAASCRPFPSQRMRRPP